ncbi:MAG: YcaQ family DNA glycosylase [Flavobacteriales bacterium]|nr:YcaQ family DNA glycosylase [Flavobacteriales bacterium]
MSYQLSNTDARNLVLQQHRLGVSAATDEVLQNLGYIQIDTLSVSARAQHHTVFSRNTNYQQSELNDLVKSRKAYEYWSHAASYLPIGDYRFSLFRKQQFKNGEQHWFKKDKKTMQYVLDRIKAEGPLQSKDFKHHEKSKEWYDWKPSKVALEQLFMEGKLMVTERVNFQKVYDLTERVLPADVDTESPTINEFCIHLIDRTIQSHGLVTEKEIGYLRKGIKPVLADALAKKVKSEELVEVKIEGIKAIYYSKKELVENLQAEKSAVYILNPFDNLVIQRSRLKTVFNFDYQIECYVPEPKRKFGYYCLPILYGNRFIGRLDPKADRKTGVFHVKKLWFEDGFVPSDDFVDQFRIQLKELASFCGCSVLRMGKELKQCIS